MKKPSSNKLLLLLSAAACLSGIAQMAQSQYVNPAQQDAVIQQDAATGLLSPGQAANLMNQENGLAAREARLLHNDGGVLTPRDAAKIAREQAQNNASLGNAVNNNARPRGFFSSLFAPGAVLPAVPATGIVPSSYYPPVPYTTYPTPPYTAAPVVYPNAAPIYGNTPGYHHRRWERDHWSYY